MHVWLAILPFQNNFIFIITQETACRSGREEVGARQRDAAHQPDQVLGSAGLQIDDQSSLDVLAHHADVQVNIRRLTFSFLLSEFILQQFH